MAPEHKNRFDLAELAGAVALTPALVAGAGVATGLIWLAFHLPDCAWPALWNVGIAVLFGFAAYHASRRGWLKV